MSIGRRRGRRRALGFTYLGLLFAVALAGAGLAQHGQDAATAVQRDRERELLFRGSEIKNAIEDYARATPPGALRWPRQLEDLLRDTRGAAAQHHLRRLYADPFTGQADWVMLPVPGQGQGFAGVRSAAKVKPLRQPPGAPDGAKACVCGWAFIAEP